MFDFDSLIGLEEDKAREILTKFGYKNINVLLNSKLNEKYDKRIVCSVRNSEKVVTLIIGEFYVDIKGE